MGMPVRKIFVGLFSIAIAVLVSMSLTRSAYSQESWQFPWSKNATKNTSKSKKVKRAKRQKAKHSKTKASKSPQQTVTAVTVGAVTLLNAEKPDQLKPGAARPLELKQAISGKTKRSALSKNLLLAQQTTENSTDTSTDIKPVEVEEPLGWNLKTRCTNKNGCQVHQDKLTQDSIKEMQAALRNIGCLAYADDLTPNWGPASVKGFKKFIEQSIELLGPSFKYDFTTKKGEAYSRKQFLDQVSHFKQTQPRFRFSGGEPAALAKAQSQYLKKNCARLSYETWDLREVLMDEKLNKPQEFAPTDGRFKPITILRQKLERFRCLGSNGGAQNSKVSWDEDAATAFRDYLCWSQTGKACPSQQIASSEKVSSAIYDPDDSYVRVLQGLMKENDEPVNCHGKTVDWDPSKIQKRPVVPFNYDREAVRRDQASKLRTHLQNAGCLRQDKVKGIWGDASVNALTAYFKKLKEWGTVPKTFEVSGIEGKLFAAVASNFDKRVTQNAYVCDPPPDHLRVCDANKALNARGVEASRNWFDLQTALIDALGRMKTAENLESVETTGRRAKWLENKLTKSGVQIKNQTQGLLDNIFERELFLAFSDPGSDCGRCQLVGAFRHLLSYQQFVNSTENLDQEPGTDVLLGGTKWYAAKAPDGTQKAVIALPDGNNIFVSPSDILSATFEDGDKMRSASIPLSEINLRMVEYAYPSILDWYKEWKKYIHSLATKRTSDELQYRHAMAGLGSVILQLKDAWNKDKQERAATKAASSAKLMALVGDYGDACKEAEKNLETPLSLANRR